MESLLITLSEIENDQPQEGENGQRGPISKNHIQDLQAIFSTSEASLWEEVVSRNISLASLVRSLSTTMESPGTIGLLASNLYLTILLSDGSPLYTLFNPVAFHSLLRSIRNSLKQSSQRFPSKPNSKKTQLRRKTKNAKRINDSEEDEALEPESQEKDGNPQGFDANILISVLENLDLVMHNLRLDGYFDSLKYLIEVVSELPMLACDFNGFTEENAATRGGKSRKVVSSSVPSPPPYESLCRLCYKIMERVLIQENGDRTLTSVEIFKMLARSILCQKSQVRVSALRFVINKVIPTESDLIRKALISLPRYLAMKAPEKTEPRALAVESIIAIIKAMNTSEQMGFAGFVMKMTQGKPRLRMIAMDLIPSLLGSLPDPLGLKEDQNFWGLRCLEALLHRCSDKVAGIRARALTNMANAIELLASDIRNRSRLQELLGFGGMGRPNNLQEKQETEEGLEAEARNAGLLFGDLRPSPFSGPGPTPITPGVGCEDLNVLLRRRCVDEKAAVRKAALFLITKSTSLLGRIPDDVTLKTIGVACSDPLVSIRKAALSALSEVDAHVQALKTLCQRKAIHEKGDQLISKWVDQVLSKALQILDDYVTEVSEMGNLDRFQTPARSGSRKKKAKGKTKMGALNPSVQAVTAIFTLGSLVLVCPSTNLKGFIPLLQTVITSGSLKPKSKEITGLVSVSAKNFSSSFYIQSWVTLGKICLVDDKLAKRYIPLFVQELEKSNSAPLRNNIMVVMTDFCVRYTALVDCYIAKITKSLCDPCEVVRRQTFILLSRLLQRDYVKWRGVLFHRFLFALVDESEKIRQLADFLIGSILKTKAPLLAYNSFVEAIFVLNGCDAHGGHSEYQSSHSESRLFSLRGPDEKTQSQRMHIYVSLLKQMAPEHLLATSAKLCAEILAAAADGLLDLNDSTGKSVLKDALQILACKEMRLQSARNTPLATDLEEEGVPPAASAFTVAKGRVVSQVAKKSLVQNAIPIFIELKKVLESRNSPLLGCLMECLRVLLKEYNNEIDEILLADKQLQKEILYDMRKYEASKAKSTVVEAMATIRRSGGYHSSVGKTSDTQANNGGGSHSRPTSIGGDRIYKAAKPSVAPNCRLSCSNSGIRGPCPKPNLGIDAGGDGINLGPNGIGGEGFSRSNICSRVQSNGNLKSSSYVDGLFRGESSNRGNCSSAVKSTDVGGGDLEGEFGNSERIVSAVADMAAAATVNVVLKDVNGGTSTPPLGTMSIPKLKGSLSDASRKSNCSQVLESLRRRETFNGSEEG
ncbi:condensin-2 complex subunit D3 isoform X2 [Amborella trichopoda]|uniref:condensin-2 complex subunit D3 isoform X2 n=1 Tax=Amborella trichopoda TaxID=13333 RepID=UPI0009BEFE61|nr:condensin-2 complex subunit D3 isoform X2 [Amborella trichopoda]|eukprot:XP_020520612.1 condensin-2 complex subunit D3 isoform X2 [Amborella trichopoda]